MVIVENKYSFRISFYLLIAVLSLLSATLYSTELEWLEHNKLPSSQPNRIEGVRGYNLSNTDLEIISSLVVTNSNLQKDPDSLSLCLYVPKEDSYKIVVQELINEESYWMESLDTTLKNGLWNYFSGWRTKPYIERYGVRLSNLAIIAISKKNERVILPVKLLPTEKKSKTLSYSFYFRTRDSLSEVRWKLQGLIKQKVRKKKLLKNQLALKGVIKHEVIGGDVFNIVVPITDDWADGMFKLTVTAETKSGSMTVREYNISHKAWNQEADKVCGG